MNNGLCFLFKIMKACSTYACEKETKLIVKQNECYEAFYVKGEE